jgi:hypothetical protein
MASVEARSSARQAAAGPKGGVNPSDPDPRAGAQHRAVWTPVRADHGDGGLPPRRASPAKWRTQETRNKKHPGRETRRDAGD